MKKLVFLGLLFIFILSCEDTKKAPTKKVNTSTNSEKKLLPSEEKKVDIPLKNYPKITKENVVQFLTDYGKENLETKVKITTTYGSIDLKLFTDTPLHRANFIYLVKQGYFNETFFHRVAPNFIIQGGSSDLKSTSIKRAEIGSNYRLPYEKGNGRIHKYGTVSGAKHYRKNPDNLSVPFEFFIFLHFASEINKLAIIGFRPSVKPNCKSVLLFIFSFPSILYSNVLPIIGVTVMPQ